MEKYELGPNGGLVFCMEYLLENIEWLKERIVNLIEDQEDPQNHSLYLIIDCPGQVRRQSLFFREYPIYILILFRLSYIHIIPWFMRLSRNCQKI
jgi:hypothetical protein